MKKTENSAVAAMKAGFTLVELLVVVAILGMLAAVAIQNFGGATDDTKPKAAKMAVDNLDGGIVTYKLKYSKLPNSLKDLVVKKGNNPPIMKGGENSLLDPWQNEYKLKKEGRNYYVMSCGEDGQEGTDDDIRSDVALKAEKAED